MNSQMFEEKALTSEIFRYRRLLMVGCGALTFTCLLMDKKAQLPSGYWGSLFQMSAAAAVISGITLRIWATRHIGGRKGRELVNTGPYALCRNPLYLGSLISTLGILVLTGSLSAAFVALTLSLGIYLIAVMHEEAQLKLIFGINYEAYQLKVPRFLPDLSRIDKALSKSAPPLEKRLLRRELITALGFILAALAATLVHAQGLIDRLF